MRRKMGTRKKASAGSNVTQLNKQIPLYQRKKWYRGICSSKYLTTDAESGWAASLQSSPCTTSVK